MITLSIIIIALLAGGASCLLTWTLLAKRFRKKIVDLEQQILENGWKVLELEKEKKEIGETYFLFKKIHEETKLNPAGIEKRGL